jgi:hypothetical protein
LNPRYPLRYVRFRGGSFQPLTHLSGKQWPVAGGQWPVPLQLPAASKELLQEFCATACQYSAADFYFVVQLRVIQYLHYRLHGTRLGIVGAVDQALDPGVHQRTGAHRARFNCSKQVAVLQAMVTDGYTGFAEGYDFGMGCGIVVDDVAVPAAADDAAFADYDRSYWDFARFERALRAAQGFFHPQFV